MTPQELLEDMLSYAIPTDKAIEWLHQAIVIGKEAEKASQEEARRQAWRAKVADDDGPEAAAAQIGAE